MEMPMDYHLIFIVLSFILFILTMLLLFIEPTVEKATAAMILIALNLVFCIVISLSFQAIDYYGFDSDGAVVHNIYTDMWPLHVIWFALFYINFMLMVYCGYLFWQKPWEEYAQQEKRYQDTALEY